MVGITYFCSSALVMRLAWASLLEDGTVDQCGGHDRFNSVQLASDILSEPN